MPLIASNLDSLLDAAVPNLFFIGGLVAAGVVLLVLVWLFFKIVWQPSPRTKYKLTWRQSLDLPLLRKELKELAARRRTYIIRILYGCLLLTVSWSSMAVVATRASGNGVLGFIGTGKLMYDGILWFQVYGVLLMTPALSCGAITSEKERNTLGLLFLTRLGPWTILFEKLCSRLIPIMTFLLLSMPLLAIAYSFGGVETTYMATTIGALFAVAVEMATLSLLCSTVFRTTSAAFIWSYLSQLIVVVICWIGLTVVMMAAAYWLSPNTIAMWWWFPSNMLIPGTVLALVIAALNMSLARFFLVRRAFIQPKQVVLKFFKKLDRSFHALNERYTRGIVLVKENVGLPDDQPIAWRETKKRSLGTVRYLFRVFVAIELPLVAFCLLLTIDGQLNGRGGMTFAVAMVWILSILIMTVHAASLIASERSHETLNVLLTTNLSSREIIQQKFAGVKRVIQVLRVPLITVCFFELYVFGGWRRGGIVGFHPLSYLTGSVLAVWIYPLLFGWLGVFVSLFVKKQSRAVLTTLCIILVWCVGPVFFIDLVHSYQLGPQPDLVLSIQRLLGLSSPAMIIGLNESGASRWLPVFDRGFETSLRLVVICVNFAFYGAIAFSIRHLCYRWAGVRLGRNDGTTVKTKKNDKGPLVGPLPGKLIGAELD
ncbi:ABC transporter permease [bacterium]|nr:ABC transporter permease [bacterium]